MKGVLKIYLALAMLGAVLATDLPEDMNNDNDKFYQDQLDQMTDDINNSFLGPLMEAKAGSLNQFLLDNWNDYIANYDFKLQEFQIGMAMAILAMVFEFSFLKFLPTFSWIPYVYGITIDSHPFDLFVVMWKIGVEMYHQLQWESYPERSLCWEDLLVALGSLAIVALNGRDSYLMGLIYMDMTKNLTLFTMLHDI